MKLLKILFAVNNDHPESYPLELAAYMKEKGNEVAVAVLYKKKNEYDNTSGLDCFYANATSIKDFKAIFRFLKFIKNYKPAIVHTHHTLSAFLASIYCRINGIPSVFTVHNDHRFLKAYQNTLNFFTFIFSNLIICNSENSKNQFFPIEKLISRRKTYVVYNGVNVNRIYQNSEDKVELAGKYGFNKDAIILATAGRLVWQKDFGTLVKAVSKVIEINKNVQFLLIGDGALRNELQSMISEYNVEKNIIITGSLNRDEVYKLINITDMFLMSSSSEGFCNALVEAMAVEKPVVCSGIPIFREVAGSDGFFAEFHNENEFKNSIIKILNKNNDERIQIGSRLKERVDKLFCIENTVNNYLKFYKSLIKN